MNNLFFVSDNFRIFKLLISKKMIISSLKLMQMATMPIITNLTAHIFKLDFLKLILPEKELPISRLIIRFAETSLKALVNDTVIFISLVLDAPMEICDFILLIFYRFLCTLNVTQYLFVFLKLVANIVILQCLTQHSQLFI